MLQALELVGFKSFADRTRLEFPPGITVVVGPNGSGKSNIVDAIKWVLGEQSAKSLRGKEMSDVIFKGGGAGRKPSNTAEATIVFDNSGGLLSVDTPEVHVTRRVYRSGEGEYLLNRQACRLKDVRDLFRGTGVGTDAYSLIEQGKVDTLLQASAKDRRAIFEEAAGISRFKAKKVEAQRRLERVEQNLLRLADIVDEVESRLKSIRAQATKAQRYREFTQRLQELRTQVACVDWRRLTEQIQKGETESQACAEEAETLSSRQQALEARILETETEIALLDEELRTCEAQVAQTTERIRALAASAGRERERVADAERQCSRYRRQLLAMNTRAVDVVGELRDAREELVRAEAEHASAEETLKAANQRVETLTADQARVRKHEAEIHAKQGALLRNKSELEHQQTADQARLKSLEASSSKIQDVLQQIASNHEKAAERLADLQTSAISLAEGLSQQERELAQAQAEQKASRKKLAETQRNRSKKLGEQAGCIEQVKILEELESRLEGVDAGVKRVLELKRTQPTQPYTAVRGLIAELISVNVEFAPLVDVALGHQAQCLVFAGSTLVEHLQAGQYDLPGRVSFLGLESAIPLDHTYHVDIAGQPGIIGRADKFVDVPREYRLLIRRLLGTTWFVETLEDALNLIHGLGQGLRYVTRKGELLDVDERVSVGPLQNSVGLVSRRSQLRSLQRRVEELTSEIEEMSQREADLTGKAEQWESRAEALAAKHQEAAAKMSQQNANIEAAQQRLVEVQAQLAEAQSDCDRQQRERQEIEGRLGEAADGLDQMEQEITRNGQALEGLQQQLVQLDEQQQEAAEVCTAARVAQAKKEQRLEGLQTHIAQLQRDQQEREGSRKEAERNLRDWTSTLASTELDILRASSRTAELYLEEEAATATRLSHIRRRQSLDDARKSLSTETTETRDELRSVEERQHRVQLLSSQARQERENLAQRMHDDYQIDMEQLDAAAELEVNGERESVEQEIEDLRRKISNIGPVNLEALNELDEIEDRHGVLAGQYHDLIEAKESLGRIIQKINKDSRRLFKETLEAIRVNFVEMFRKVFGGGRADIVLEEGVDILDAGIEIVATPPGKQSLGLSLLSGGERALTAVTLLLAIFKYRPSPFCVLDEVDGPLDESNVGRFIEVLQSFLDTTKFVVVTHSKKTMTAATTLYGITMQEAGVSKRVAVQFEDVSDDGHISEEAATRQDESDAAGDDERGAA